MKSADVVALERDDVIHMMFDARLCSQRLRPLVNLPDRRFTGPLGRCPKTIGAAFGLI